MILATDSACKKHDAGAGHPEKPARYDAVIGALKAAGLHGRCREVGPRKVAREDLLLVHDAGYLEKAEREIHEGRKQLSTGDTGICVDSWDAAMAAGGCAMAAVEAVVKGEDKTAFCAIRPPGHHA